MTQVINFMSFIFDCIFLIGTDEFSSCIMVAPFVFMFIAYVVLFFYKIAESL